MRKPSPARSAGAFGVSQRIRTRTRPRSGRGVALALRALSRAGTSAPVSVTIARTGVAVVLDHIARLPAQYPARQVGKPEANTGELGVVRVVGQLPDLPEPVHGPLVAPVHLTDVHVGPTTPRRFLRRVAQGMEHREPGRTAELGGVERLVALDPGVLHGRAATAELVTAVAVGRGGEPKEMEGRAAARGAAAPAETARPVLGETWVRLSVVPVTAQLDTPPPGRGTLEHKSAAAIALWPASGRMPACAACPRKRAWSE